MTRNFGAEPLKFECSVQLAYKITNVAEVMSAPVDSKSKPAIADLCDGWQLRWKVTEDAEDRSLSFFLSLPERRLGTTIVLNAELRQLDGPLLTDWTMTKKFSDSESPHRAWGHSVISKSELLDRNRRVRKDDAFLLILNMRTLQGPVDTPQPSRAFLSASKAINASITSPFDHRDLKFLSFNSKPGRNLGDHIQESFASSRLLAKRTDYFASHAAFAEGADLMDETPDSLPKFEDTYDYMSDSDLESEEGEDDQETEQENQVDDQDDEGDDEDNENDDKESKEMSGGDSDSQSSHSSDDSGMVDVVDLSDYSKRWKVIVLGDIAHKTWLATLGFLYTNVIRFAPLSTKGDNNEAYHKQERVAFPEASCKSVFRVADKMGIKDLEDRAFDFLKSQMDDDTIFQELFSPFTARYDRLKDMESEYLFANWSRLKSSGVLKTMLNEVTIGQRPESVWLLPRVFGRLA